MKHRLLPIVFTAQCFILSLPSLGATLNEQVASAAYVDNRVNEMESRTVNKDEFKTFSDELPNRFVGTTENQTISGVKTYTSSPIVPTPPLP